MCTHACVRLNRLSDHSGQLPGSPTALGTPIGLAGEPVGEFTSPGSREDWVAVKELRIWGLGFRVKGISLYNGESNGKENGK